MEQMKTFMSLFSGAGGADCGAISAGYTPICAVEYDPYAAALYRQNFGDHVREENILDTPIDQLPDVEFLWASPVCVQFSTAKTDGKELQLDIDCAQKTADIIRAIAPRHFALENVRGYLNSQSFRIIYATLEEMGYNLHHGIYDAASFGVPQNRNRLILRASRDRLRLLQPTHAKVADMFHLPWHGWHGAVEDLLRSCKPTHLTEKQIQSLEKRGWGGSALIEGNKQAIRDVRFRGKDLPSYTVCASTTRPSHLPAAILVEGKDSPSRDRTLRKPDEPCMTVTANNGGGGRLPKAVLIDCKGNRYMESFTSVNADVPSPTVVASSASQRRAVLLSRSMGSTTNPGTPIDEETPSFTVTSNDNMLSSRAVILERTGYPTER